MHRFLLRLLSTVKLSNKFIIIVVSVFVMVFGKSENTEQKKTGNRFDRKVECRFDLHVVGFGLEKTVVATV